MRVALVSLDQAWLDKEANFHRCRNFVHKAVDSGCELVIFPEMTLTGYSLAMKDSVEPMFSSPTLQRFGKLAMSFGVDIIFGACLRDPDTGQPQNQFCLARRNGNSVALYAKVHPFSFAGEHKVLEAGSRTATAEVAGLNFSASICYDLRFPELYAMTALECNSFITIANWPARRVSHWYALLVARAIENQSFAIGVNRTGIDGNQIAYEKSSMVIAPDGAILTPAIAGSEIDIFDIDPSVTTHYRNEFPTISDKRFNLYHELLKAKHVR